MEYSTVVVVYNMYIEYMYIYIYRVILTTTIAQRRLVCVFGFWNSNLFRECFVWFGLIVRKGQLWLQLTVGRQ